MPNKNNNKCRRFVNISKIFDVQFNNKKEHNFFYNLYKFTISNDNIHNLSKIDIPMKYKCILSLGLKYCTQTPLTQHSLQKHVNEAARKIAWKIFFKINPTTDDKTEYEKWFNTCKKDYRKTYNAPGIHYEFEHEYLNVSKLYDSLSSQLLQKRHPSIISVLVNEFKDFCTQNSIIIVQADKNAGICVVSKNDYETEILRQLNDITTYHPCTQTQFDFSMIEFRDKLKCFDKLIDSKYKLSNLLPIEDQPATFYILPKIHKPFVQFPKGRPISSTSKKSNKYPSKLLDQALKPCLSDIKDLLIDTQHFLLLINEVKLQPNRRYAMVTVDIESLYTNLKLSDCMNHCLDAYHNCQSKSGIHFTDREIKELLALSLCYNYVKYENHWYFQHRGIEMGNAASVMVANITVYKEIHNIFDSIQELLFYKRFLDDIFLIIDITDILDLTDWLNSKLKHSYLNFTWESSTQSINFLDVTVSLEDNIIHTEIFTKPMSKHLYLHSSSNHPSHLKNSLYYSQGLRIVKICSDFTTRVKHLISLYNKFKNRFYNEKVLYPTFVRLLYIDRKEVLNPKNKLLIQYLHVNTPGILSKYNQIQTPHTFDGNDKCIVVFPFIQHVPKYKQKLKQAIQLNIQKNVNSSWKKYVLDLNIQVVFSRTKNVQEMLR